MILTEDASPAEPSDFTSEHELRQKLDRKLNVAVGSANCVLHFEQMSNTITVRLPDDLAEWLDAASRKAGVPRGRIVRDQLQLARKREKRPFMRLAGSIEGPRNLSERKGFSNS